MDEIISTLQAASSPNEVESALISLVAFDSCRLEESSVQQLTSVLDRLLQASDMNFNSKLRRRISRMRDNLLLPVKEQTAASDAKQEALAAAASASAVKGKADRVSSDVQVVSDLSAIVSMLSAASSPSELEQSLNIIVCPNGKSDPALAPLKLLLQSIYQRRDLTNKILRRRILRMLFVICTEKEYETAHAILKAHDAASAGAEANPSKPSPTSASASADRKEPAKLISDCLQELNEATSANEVEAAIVNVTGDSVGNKRELLSKLSTIVEDAALVNNAKLRRRLKRLIETLTQAVTSEHQLQNTQIAAEMKDAAKTRSELEIAESVKLLSAVSTAEELETVISSIPWEISFDDVTEMQKVHELLTRHSLDSGIVTQAKIRRRVKRAIEMAESALTRCGATPAAEPQADSVAAAKSAKRKAAEMDEPDDEGQDSESDLLHGEEDTEEEGGTNLNKSRKIPHVVFVGQLSYRASASDVERLFLQHGVQGKIVVRLMEKKIANGEPEAKDDDDAEDSNRMERSRKSRGAAFVEVENSDELHKCLKLHHTIFLGRRINVEKTCGGRNTEGRLSKLKQLRGRQNEAVRQAVDSILTDFENKGLKALLKDQITETIRNKLYEFPPSTVAEMLNDLVSRRMPQEKQLFALQGLISRRDNPTRVVGKAPPPKSKSKKSFGGTVKERRSGAMKPRKFGGKFGESGKGRFERNRKNTENRPRTKY